MYGQPYEKRVFHAMNDFPGAQGGGPAPGRAMGAARRAAARSAVHPRASHQIHVCE